MSDRLDAQVERQLSVETSFRESDSFERAGAGAVETIVNKKLGATILHAILLDGAGNCSVGRFAWQRAVLAQSAQAGAVRGIVPRGAVESHPAGSDCCRARVTWYS